MPIDRNDWTEMDSTKYKLRMMGVSLTAIRSFTFYLYEVLTTNATDLYGETHEIWKVDAITGVVDQKVSEVAVW